MNDQAFKVWRDKLVSLDRYENPEDAREFSALVSSVRDELDAKTIDLLLSTFCDDDDYGVQDRVLGVLDHAETGVFAERLAVNFSTLQSQASGKEWPLILIGRVVNSDDAEKIKAIVAAAKKSPDLDAFIRSDEFLDEYPEIESYFVCHPLNGGAQ